MSRSLNARWSIVLAPAAMLILAAALANEWFYGFRLGETAGNRSENLMEFTLVAAAVMVFAPLGRSRRLLAPLLAFLSVVTLVALNARFTTSLDVAYGGAYGWSGTRVFLTAAVVGPIYGVAGAILTFGFAHLSLFNRQASAAPITTELTALCVKTPNTPRHQSLGGA